MSTFFSELKINEGFIKDAPIPIATLDENLIFISYSKKWSIEHNIKNEDINGEYFFDVFTAIPTDFKSVLNYCLLGNSSENKKKYILNNGESIWLKWKINPWIKDKKSVVGLVISLENITKMKASEELIKDAQEVSRTGGWQVNFLTEKVQWTKMVNVIHEMPLDYVPQNFDECFHHFKKGYHRNKILAASKIAINHGTPWDEEAIMITGTGKEIWVRTKGKSEIKAGKCIRIYGICQDIDIYKRAQLKYRESAELLKHSIAASQVGTWEYYLENGETIWDDISYNLHAIDKNNKIGSLYRNWKNSIHPDDLQRVIHEAALYYERKEKGVVSYRIILPDGNIRFLKSTITFISDSNSTIKKAIGITQDITTEKLSEISLKEFAKITGEQNNSLTNFAHMVSHDLRAHSSNLSVLTSLLEEEKDENEKKQILQMLKKATNSLNSTVYNLNDVVQSTNTNISDKMVTINVLEAITNVQNNISTLFQEKKGFCVIDVSPNHHVKAIPAYFDSILLNLFTNSLKYCSTLKNPIINISTAATDQKLILTFEDNGKGIDMKKFENNIFGMNKTFHRNKDARGVGLYITKNQVNAMGGNISVHSEVDKGTKFTIEFKI